MGGNIVFCFTGTGNSLKLAKDIAGYLGDTKIVSIRDENTEIDITRFERVGFVFPVYFVGLPLQVERFIRGLTVSNSFGGYLFAVSTYANVHGNAVKQVNKLLAAKGHSLHYGNTVKMGDNAIAFYESTFQEHKLSGIYEKAAAAILPDLQHKKGKGAGCPFYPFEVYYRSQTGKLPSKDIHYTVSGGCTSCGLCARVCPAQNIQMQDNTPCFQHRCEQCMACIQLCPAQAIDYKGRCTGRTRYKNPHITVQELAAFHNRAQAKALA